VVQLVLFDIDGTLIRTGGAGVRAWERAFALEFGIPDAIRGINLAGRTDSSLVRQCFLRNRIEHTRDNVERFFDRYLFLMDHHLRESRGGSCLGVLDFIDQLNALPAPPMVGLLTGNIRLGAEIKLRHYGLWDFFRTGAFGDDDEDRNQLAVLAQRRGSQIAGAPVLGSEILVVGDTPHDVACAKAIQAQMLAVATGGYSSDELRACGPTWVVETLREIPVREVWRGGNGAPA
jgi:phosphoglycolate phosphatase-like HAD superfamily hydrolase